ncbi:MAG: hypothetical protein ACOX59_07995, partial [Bacteroidales bacterium]
SALFGSPCRKYSSKSCMVFLLNSGPACSQYLNRRTKFTTFLNNILTSWQQSIYTIHGSIPPISVVFRSEEAGWPALSDQRTKKRKTTDSVEFGRIKMSDG